ncbi:hypothetical protein Esti_002467 [Eimeria stiedai]
MIETGKVVGLPHLSKRPLRGALPNTELPILGRAIRAGEADDELETTEKDSDLITSRAKDSSLQKAANIMPKDDTLVLNRTIHKSPSTEHIEGCQRILVAELPATYPATCQAEIKVFTYLGLGATDASQGNEDNPVVVYEHPSYWVVRKPLGWPSCCKEKEEDVSGPVRAVISTSESLAMFVRSMYPGINSPILWSRQHNFGVIFLLEEPWFGLTIIAKSEEAFLSLETIVESQLFHCYLECFVTGPPLRAVTKLYGKTAIGTAVLCAEVLRSAVCRTAGGSIANSAGTNRSTVANSEGVVSNVILRVNFPPALLSDVLWCNGMIIAPDPYSAKILGTKENACTTKLCCFGISFPSSGMDDTSESCPPEERVTLQTTTSLPRKRPTRMITEKRAWTALVQAWPVLSTYKRVTLYAGVIVAAPVALKNVLSKVTSWGFGTRWAAALVERMLHKCTLSVLGLKMCFVPYSSCLFSTLASRNDLTTRPMEPEILFGHREVFSRLVIS